MGQNRMNAIEKHCGSQKLEVRPKGTILNSRIMCFHLSLKILKSDLWNPVPAIVSLVHILGYNF